MISHSMTLPAANRILRELVALLSALLLVVASSIFSTSAWAQKRGDQFCSPGEYSQPKDAPGAYYNPKRFQCVGGRVIGHGERICPKGVLGDDERKYSPKNWQCYEGILLRPNERWCPEGSVGQGGKYATPRQYCLDGLVLGANQRWCPSADGKGGSKYDVPRQYCLDGRVMRDNERWCPSADGKSGGVYTPPKDKCPTVSETDGGVQYVTGKVTVTDASGKPKTLGPGTVLAEGDRVETGSDGRLTYMFPDTTVTQFVPESALTVVEKRHVPQGCTLELCRTVVDIAKGGLRWITGAVKSFAPGTTIKTANAAFGIRGTDFDVYHLATPGRFGEATKLGSYLRVSEGIVYIRSGEQETDFKAGSLAFVPAPGQPPEVLKDVPLVFSVY